MSYYLFLYLLIEALGNQADAIKRLTGRSTCFLKIRTITCDFELGIINGRLFIFFSFKFQHIYAAFKPFRVRGCFFHWSQSLWRRVQAAGMVPFYVHDKSFRVFVRLVFDYTEGNIFFVSKNIPGRSVHCHLLRKIRLRQPLTYWETFPWTKMPEKRSMRWWKVSKRIFATTFRKLGLG